MSHQKRLSTRWNDLQDLQVSQLIESRTNCFENLRQNQSNRALRAAEWESTTRYIHRYCRSRFPDAQYDIRMLESKIVVQILA